MIFYIIYYNITLYTSNNNVTKTTLIIILVLLTLHTDHTNHTHVTQLCMYRKVLYKQYIQVLTDIQNKQLMIVIGAGAMVIPTGVNFMKVVLYSFVITFGVCIISASASVVTVRGTFIGITRGAFR